MASDVFKKIKLAIGQAPQKGYVAELHLQVIKYADALEKVTGREFCQELGLNYVWGTEFSKMKRIAERLREAGLDPDKI